MQYILSLLPDGSRTSTRLRSFKSTRNTTPTKPREGRFGCIGFVCNLKFSRLVFQLRAKTEKHCASYIVDKLTAARAEKLKNCCQFTN